MAWVIGFAGIAAGTATQQTLHTDDMFNNIPAEVRIHGTSLTYDANGFINGGTITSMELVDVSGPSDVVLQSVTMTGGLAGSELGTYFAAASALKTDVADWSFDFVGANGQQISGGMRLTGVDGRYVDILGTGFTQEGGGTVTSVTLYAANGSQIDAIPANLLGSLDSLIVAIGGYTRSFYAELVKGDNTITATDDNLLGLEGGGGNDTIQSTATNPGLAQFRTATSGVTVDLANQTATGGGVGTDALANIWAAEGSAFGDTLIGNAENNSLFGQLGDDTLTGNGGNDYFAYVPEMADIGNDTITDFTVGTDQIQITKFNSIDSRADLTFTDIGSDVKVTIAGVTGSILVKNVTASQLDADTNFFFAPGNGGGGGGNQPTVSISALDASKNEGASGTNTFTFKVTRTGDTSGTSSVHWAVSAQSGATADDFVGGQLPSGDVTFTSGQTEQIITVNVAGDTQSETNEAFSVDLSNATNATIGTGTASGTILDDDTNNSKHYNDWSQVLDVTKAPSSFTDNRITFDNTDGTQTVINGSGFSTPGTSTIASIERHIANTSVLVSVTGGLPTLTTIMDTFAEVAAVAAQISWQIAGQGLPEFSLDGTWLLFADGDGTYTKLVGTGLPTAPNTGPTGTIDSVVHVAADKATQVGTDAVTFTPAITIGLFVAAAFGEAGYVTDVMFGGNNTVTSSVAQGWHINLEGGPGNDTFVGGAADEGFEVGSGTDTIDGGGGFNTITNWDDLAPMTADLLSKTASGAGWTATFTNIQGVSGTSFADTLSGDNASNHIQGEGGDDTLTGRGGDDTFFYFGADIDSANLGNDTITDFQVGIDRIMLLQFANVTKMADLTITNNLAGDAVISVPGGTGTITLTGVAAASLGESSFAFTNNGGGGNGAALSIAADKASKNEGNTGNTAFTFFVNRTGDTGGAASVEWSLSLPDGTADAADFAGATNGTVYFTAGETQKQITVNVAGDLDVEGDETFTVALSNPTGGTYIATGKASGSILEDDGAPQQKFFDWRLAFNGGAPNSGPAIEATGSKIVLANNDGTRTVMNGSSFTYTNGEPTGGTITSIQLVESDGTTVRTTVTAAAGSTLPTIAALQANMKRVDDLRLAITWYGIVDQNSQQPVSFSSTQLVLPNTDGSRTVIVGTGLQVIGDGNVFAGTVSSIRHVSAGGTTLATVAAPTGTTFAQALAAVYEYQANQYFFSYLFSGNNVLVSNFAADGGGTLFGGAGNDTITGGTGYDVVEYDTATSAVVVNLKAGTATGGGGTDALKGAIEGVSGSAFADTITGSDGDNEIKGRDGDDRISGLAGIDWLHGDAGNDTLEGGTGADVLMGGDGSDTASYAGSASGVTVDLNLQGTDPGIGDAPAQTSGGDAGGDKLYGIESLTGSAQGDMLTGDGGNNRIDGGLGNDVIEGGAGDDVLVGGGGTATTPGNDTVSYAGAGAGVTVNLALATKQNTGGAGADTLTGFESAIGSAYADKLIGTSGDNTLLGGLGDDILIGGAGKDTLIGGGGKDAASYETATAGVTANLADKSKNTGDAAGDTYDGIGRLIGSNFDDKLTGDSESNRLVGLAGNDTLEGGGEADYFDGGAGVDTVTYKGSKLGVDVSLIDDAFGPGVNGEGGDAQGDHYVWDAGAGRSTIENIIGSDESDTLTGDKGNNRLDGGDGSDTIDGGAGDDILVGGLNSNSGDTVTYATAAAAVTVNLSLTTQQDTKGAGKDTLSGFENLIGSDYADTLTGSASTLVGDDIDGGAGNDVIKGQAGDDQLAGGDGDDVIEGGLGKDELNGGANGLGGDTVSYAASTGAVTVDLDTGVVTATIGDGVGDEIANFENVVGSNLADTLTGDTGDNVLEGLGGDDKLTGGDGVDTASYARAAGAVTVSLGVVGTKQTTGGAGADMFTDAFENLTGSAFDDKLTGDAGVNTIAGGKGNDTIEGKAGADRLDGGEGTGDTVSYAGSAAGVRVEFEYFDVGTSTFKDGQDGTFAQAAVGGDSDGDVLSGFENVTGSGLDDILYGDAKNNKIVGGAGDDRIEGGLGDDVLDGGTNGTFGDIVSYERAASGVTVNLSLTTQQDTKGAGKDTIANFERLRGSTHDDTLTGSAKAEVIKGDEGDDIIQGGAGADELDGGDGIDTVSYQASTAAVLVDLGANIQALKYGLAANNGDATGDELSLFENVIGSNSADTLTGDAGDNVIEGLGGDDKLTGGGGIDTVSYQRAAAGVTVNLGSAAKQATGGAGSDTLVDTFENLTGSAFDDKLTGNDLANLVLGGKGNDTISGGLGQDTLDGGEGNDTIEGGAGIDTLIGGSHLVGGGDTVSYANSAAGVNVDLGKQDGGKQAGGDAEDDVLSGFENILGSGQADILTGDGNANRIVGGNGSDTIEGGAGNDLLYGGTQLANDLPANVDILSYEHAGSAVKVSLALTTQQDTLGAGKDTVMGFEALMGSAFGDTLTGSATGNTIWGLDGDDLMIGGGGVDVLYGGIGADTFQYSGLGDAGDFVKDFLSGTDKLQFLASGFAGTVKGATVNFTSATDPLPGGATKGWFLYDTDDGKLYFDADGTGAGAKTLLLTLDGHPTLVASDIKIV